MLVYSTQAMALHLAWQLTRHAGNVTKLGLESDVVVLALGCAYMLMYIGAFAHGQERIMDLILQVQLTHVLYKLA